MDFGRTLPKLTNCSSVERIVEYLDLPQEPPAIIESNRPPAYWPSSATNETLIVVEDLVIKYAPELPPVLHGVSFTLRAKERVGLLGRTGWFRFQEHIHTLLIHCDR
jgi:ABC-type multidrug transport system fused ATPase/permease subunit